jgi:hypothetical protein
VDVSLSPLADLVPDRCTPELLRLQAELSARHSYREAAQTIIAKGLKVREAATRLNVGKTAGSSILRARDQLVGFGCST